MTDDVSPLTPEEVKAMRHLLREREAGSVAWKWACIVGAFVLGIATLGNQMLGIWSQSGRAGH